MTPVRVEAPGKVNLVLRVGAPRADGLHPLASLFARIELADQLEVEPAAADEVVCPEVPEGNLVAEAISAFRARAPLPPLRVEIRKRIPVAGGLGGGSADAAAILRAANELSARPLPHEDLHAIAAALGSDVPSQLEPGHSVVAGTGEVVEPVELPAMALVLLPQDEGLATGAVYRELDRMRAGDDGPDLDLGPLRQLAAGPLERLARGLENDLEPAALSLRPELRAGLEALRARGALAARVTGSGPTVFGVFPGRREAETAAGCLDRAIVTEVR